MPGFSTDKKITVIGAGYMGSAITFPLTDNGYKVNLVGTWLDDEIIESSRKGYHPKLKKPLQDGVNTFLWEEMQDAVNGSDIIFIGVLSEGFVNVFSKIMDALDKKCIFYKLTKGIVEYKGGIVRATQAAEDMFSAKFPGTKLDWITVGGPVKAYELSEKISTASIYGLSDRSLKEASLSFSTGYYPVLITYDIAGVEVSSAFKNVYSIAIGICDGLFKSTHEGNYHNLNAFLFSQACREIALIAEKAGGKEETVFDLAGIGDFYVASVSGRNRKYGELVGKGEKPDEAYKRLFKEGEVAEGYRALELGINWVKTLDKDLLGQLPLLSYLYGIVFEFKDPSSHIQEFVLEMRRRWQKY